MPVVAWILSVSWVPAMLVHFPCDRCGAELTAQPDFAGRTIPCSVCRRPVVVPVVGSPPPVQPRLKRVEFDEGLAADIAARANEEAQRLAMVEARRETIRGRVEGVVLSVAGTLAMSFGGAGLLFSSQLWVPRGSGMAALAFGLITLLIGVTVWRLSVETMHQEFRRRVPGIADRLRRRYWEAHNAASPPTTPRIAIM
ncbi:MAG: hypothetical protein FJX75_21305 [Armatimonadetes bacterium]|nr:hypothetical protein [Armatimonadota bacterium]